MILEQLPISAFGLLDTFWVGKLGAAVVSIVSCVFPPRSTLIQ